MGNQLAPPSKVGVEQFADLPNLVLKDTLGGGRFLKTLLCAHDNGGLVVVKVFDKRKEVQSLAPFKQQLHHIRERLLRVPCPHVWPMQLWWESSGAAFMARQHLAANLYDRLSTRPFLTQLEKRWIMFQLLQGMSQAHAQGVNHGDLKTENVLLTSWQWVVIADWASYKPTYLPASNPADFSYYFDTGSRRRCYIAPERFHDAPMAAINAYAPLTPAMDIFSLGCVIAELFMDGKAFLDLGTLLAYRRGEADLGRLLAAAGVPGDVTELVLHMIQRDPGQRWTADHYLTSWPRPLFPPYFNEVLHPFLGSLLHLDPDARVAAIAAGFDHLQAMLGANRSPPVAAASVPPADSRQGAAAASDAGKQRQQQQQEAVQGGAPASSGAAAGAAAGAARPGQHEDTGLLLDDMDTLWGEVTGLQHKLTTLGVQGTVAGSLGEDDGICLEEGPQAAPAAAGGLAPVTSSTSAAAAGAVVAQPPGSQAVSAGGPAGSAQEVAAAADGAEDAQVGSGMVLVVVLLCTLLRGTVLLESKVAVMRLLRRAAVACSSEVRLQTVVPYLSTLINHPSIVIRVMALRGMVQVMASLPGIPPSDAKVYQDYLFPSLSMLPSDKDELLQVEYQKGVGLLAAAAHRHLLQLQYTSSGGSGSTGPSRGVTSSPSGLQDQEASSSRRSLGSGRVSFGSGSGDAAAATAAVAEPAAASDQAVGAATAAQAAAGGGAGVLTSRASTPQPTVVVPAIRFDQELSSVLQQVVLVIQNAATGSFTTWNTWRAMLRQTAALARLLGRSGINEGLLPIFMSCMNSREWQLRAAFFQAVVEVSTAAGQHSLDAFFVPVLEQAIADKEVPVLVYALQSLSAMAPHLRKRTLLAVVSKLLPLLQHPAVAVRAAVVGAVAAAARVLPAVDVYTRLSPMVSGVLGVVPLTLTDETDIMACLPPYVEAQEEQARLLAAHLQQSGQQGQAQAAAAAGSPRPPPAAGTRSPDPQAAGESAEAAAAACCPVLPYLMDHDYRGSSLVIQPQAALYTVDLQAAGGGAVQGLNLNHNRGSSSSSSGEASEGRGGLQGGYTALLGGAGEDETAAAADPGAALWGTGAAASGPLGGGHRRHDSANWSDAQAAAASGWHGSGPARLSAAGSAGSQSIPAAAGGASASGPPSYRSTVAAQLLRARPTTTLSQLGAAVSAKQQQLEEALRRLLEEANAARGDRDAPDVVDKQQLERLQTTLARLHHRAGRDVRPPSSLLVHKLLALSLRTAPLQLLSAANNDRTQALSGAQVSDAISAALHTGLMQGATALDGSPMAAAASAAAVSGPSWRPRGVLVSHLMEHRKAVNGLAVAAGGAVLVSCSNDETVKVWDVRRLERDVSFQSRLTYAGQTGRITAVAGCGPGAASIASASSRGSLHVWQVEYVQRAGGGAPDKYTGISCQRQISSGDEGAILALSAGATANPTAADPCDPCLLLYTTQRGGTHALDLRVNKDVWRVPVAPSLGLCTHMLADPQGCTWLLQATSCGWLTLWDTRFLVPVLTWRHPLQRGVDALALAPGPPGRLGLQLGASGARLRPGTGLVYIAAGQQEIGLWDLEQGACHQVLRVLSPAEGPQAAAMPPASLQLSTRPCAPLPDLAATTSSLLPHSSRASSQGGSSGGKGARQGGQEAAMPTGGLAGAAGVAGGPPLGELDTNQLLKQLEQQLAVGKIHEPQARSAGCYALLALPTGQLLSGGSDRCLRYWEPAWPERSYLVAGPLWQEDRPIVDSSSGKVNVPCMHRRYDARLFDGTPVLSEMLVGAGDVQQARVEAASELGSQLRCHDLVHADAITAMCCVDSYTGTTAVGGAGRMLASASRDGCVKVWK